MLNPAQQDLVKEAIALSKTIPLGEAYRHVSSSAMLNDFQSHLAPSNLTPQSLSLYALGTLAGDGQPNEADWRRLLALSKVIIRAQKTRQRLGQNVSIRPNLGR